MKFTLHFIDGCQRTYAISANNITELQERFVMETSIDDILLFKSTMTGLKELVNMKYVIRIEEFIERPDNPDNYPV